MPREIVRHFLVVVSADVPSKREALPRVWPPRRAQPWLRNIPPGAILKFTNGVLSQAIRVRLAGGRSIPHPT